jgi:replicative DNA helicase
MTDVSIQADAEAEQSLLGAVLVNPQIYYRVADVTPEHFHQQMNGWIWGSIRELMRNNQPVDVMTVTDQCQRMGHDLVKMGKLAYLIELLNAAPSSMHAEAYARIVLDKSARRKLLNIATAIGAGAHNAEKTVDGIITAAMEHLQTTAVPDSGATQINVDHLIEEFLERQANPVEVWGIRTGFDDYDKAYGGIHPGELVLIAGNPGAGKSSLVAQIGFQMAGVEFYPSKVNSTPGAMYHLEMSADMVLRRAACSISEIPMARVRTGNFGNYHKDANAYANALDTLRHAPVYISDDTRWTTASLQADIARLRNEHGIQWVVVDYVGLLNDAPGAPQIEREMRISIALKNIAKTMNVAILAVEKLNKTGFSGSDGLEGVTGSVQKTYDAHVVAYIKTPPDAMPNTHGQILDRQLRMQKVRDGQAGVPINLIFKGEYYKFLPAARREVRSLEIP